MKTAIILVVYQFDRESLRPVIENLCGQANTVCVVDNSDKDSSDLFADYPSVVYFPLLSNHGIAEAQNTALRYIQERDYDFVFFSDQDSIFEAGLVDKLIKTFIRLNREIPHLGGVSPRARNKTTHQLYSHQINCVAERSVEGVGRVSELTFLISSGSLIPCRVFQKVGLMEETLFIDAVECEWCWRARAKHGYAFYVIESLFLDHLLGIGTKRVSGRDICITPPFRLRFQFRNYLWLLRRGYVPMKWKLYNGAKYLAKIFYYTLLASHKKENAKHILRGIYEGLFKYRHTPCSCS